MLIILFYPYTPITSPVDHQFLPDVVGSCCVIRLDGFRMTKKRILSSIKVSGVVLKEYSFNSHTEQGSVLLNYIILNSNNSTSSFNAPNYTFFCFTRVYFLIRIYYHLDHASPIRQASRTNIISLLTSLSLVTSPFTLPIAFSSCHE
jgi:hypothetical protein